MTVQLIGAADNSYVNSDANNWFILDRWQASATGTLTAIKVYCAGTSGHVKVAVYADNNGEPGALLSAVNTSTALTINDWTTITLSTTVNVTSGTYYWLAFIADDSVVPQKTSGGTERYKSQTYFSFTFPDPAGSGFSSGSNCGVLQGWGYTVQTISPSGIASSVALGTPTIALAGNYIYPTGIPSSVALGTPTVIIDQFIAPPGIASSVALGSPTIALRLQIIAPSGIASSLAFGTPSIGFAGHIYPTGIPSSLALGTPTVIRFRYHVIIEGKYAQGSQAINRAYVIGEDTDGNPVFGTGSDSAEIDLMGERLDFSQELSIATAALAEGVAQSMLAKRRLATRSGYIVIPPNAGAELWDVVLITDTPANQSAQHYRILGIRFDYQPRQARYQHKLLLGAR
jgi:hypothetical protein